MAKSGRKSKVVMKSETGETREAKIGALVAAGMPNEAIWAAMENIYPSTIEDDVRREKTAGKAIAYDAGERQRLGWAIRSVKGLMIKEDDELREMLEITGVGEMKGADDTEFSNRHRFMTGIPAMDYIYGHTTFVWEKDAPNSQYKTEEYQVMEPGGKLVTKKRNVWVSGDYKCGNYYPRWEPGADRGWFTEDAKEAKVEHGFPYGFMSIWGGAPGTGKTRLAIALAKALNRLGQRVLYFNGEADESDFRGWLGPDVNGDLLKVFSSELVRTEQVCNFAYKYQAPVIIVDSWQMLAEVSKGNRGALTTCSRFKLLKSDPNAGRPHIICISQLNKQDKLSGSRKIEHMFDCSVKVTRLELGGSRFVFETMKNRGAECPLGAIFQHTEHGVECVSTGLTTAPIYKLMQPSSQPDIAAGIQEPPENPNSQAEEEAEEIVE